MNKISLFKIKVELRKKSIVFYLPKLFILCIWIQRLGEMFLLPTISSRQAPVLVLSRPIAIVSCNLSVAARIPRDLPMRDRQRWAMIRRGAGCVVVLPQCSGPWAATSASPSEPPRSSAVASMGSRCGPTRAADPLLPLQRLPSVGMRPNTCCNAEEGRGPLLANSAISSTGCPTQGP